jgi:hypothetical protein
MAKSFFDDVVENVSIPRLERELERDKRRYRRLLGQYNEMRNELDDQNAEIQRRTRFLDSLREVSKGDRASKSSGTEKLTKPQIAQRVLLESIEPLYPRQVGETAVRNGWLRDDPASRNQLSVAMSKMAKRRRLIKDRQGRYSLPDRV